MLPQGCESKVTFTMHCYEVNFYFDRRRNSKNPRTAKPSQYEIPMRNINDRRISIKNLGYNNESNSSTAEGSLAESAADGTYQEIDAERKIYEELRGQEKEISYQKIVRKAKSDHAVSKSVRLYTVVIIFQMVKLLLLLPYNGLPMQIINSQLLSFPNAWDNRFHLALISCIYFGFVLISFLAFLLSSDIQ